MLLFPHPVRYSAGAVHDATDAETVLPVSDLRIALMTGIPPRHRRFFEIETRFIRRFSKRNAVPRQQRLAGRDLHGDRRAKPLRRAHTPILAADEFHENIDIGRSAA